ncbi:MAG: leucyl aminopeptidase [candidate division Zixibacteria bacterium SM23_73_2]|nr:MAG: leucyl aminopeptidase [candidate division Zixibacteria bacterium SM23_73_2]
MEELKKSAEIAVNNCMAVKKGETVLVITDQPLRKIGQFLWEAANDATTEAMLLEIIPRTSNGEEPPPQVAEFMKGFDVVLIPTSKSMTHTKARRDACESGARVATLPGIREDTMQRTLSADYHNIAKRCSKIAQALEGGKTAKVTTPFGTDITLSLEGREWRLDTGLYHNPGDYGNLPAGEVFIAPLEGKANGIIVVDGAMAGLGMLKKPLKMQVKDGYVTDISGDKKAEELEKMIAPFGKDAKNIAELGIGTNDKAEICGSVLEDEKVMGTVHLAIGDNKSMGGEVSVQSHLDGILSKPTLKIDGKVIMKDGEFMI